jgi:hypothetical protein
MGKLAEGPTKPLSCWVSTFHHQVQAEPINDQGQTRPAATGNVVADAMGKGRGSTARTEMAMVDVIWGQ